MNPLDKARQLEEKVLNKTIVRGGTTQDNELSSERLAKIEAHDQLISSTVIKAGKHARGDTTLQVEELNEVIMQTYSLKKAIPLDKIFKSRYVIDDKQQYRWAVNSDIVAFKDHGDKIVSKSKSESVPADLIKLALSKGWYDIKVNGSREFKQKVWMEAQDSDIKVTGYKPTSAELKAMNANVNSIEPTTDRKTDIHAQLKNTDRDTIAKHDDQLKALISHEKAAIVFAKQKLNSASQTGFVVAVMNTMVQKAAKGEKIALVQVADKEQAAVAER